MTRSQQIHSREGTITYTQSTALVLFNIPRYAKPLRVTVFTEATATSATLDLGTVEDPNKYVSGLDISAVGGNEANLLVWAATSVPETIVGTIGGGPSSGGPFTVVMEFRYLRDPGM